MIKRVAITGPESTGKTWLAEKLAACYKTIWVPEFARQYLFDLQRPYTYDDILIIAQNQFAQTIHALKSANQILFCDTELIVTKIWCDVKFGRCHEWIDEHIQKQNFDFYLLADIDLPWEADPQREHPNLREYLMSLYVAELEKRKFQYSIISGSDQTRLDNAIAEVIRITGCKPGTHNE